VEVKSAVIKMASYRATNDALRNDAMRIAREVVGCFYEGTSFIQDYF
jgi:hypothetical protein